MNALSLTDPWGTALAGDYDRHFTETALGRQLRRSVWHYCSRIFLPDMRLLELGCGTGEDALYFARRGLRVTATDNSAGMLSRARHKAEAAGFGSRISWVRAEASRLTALVSLGPFDAVFSNFGVLNSLTDLKFLADSLGAMLRPGGKAVFVVMGHFCLWETAWGILRFDWKTACRRWSKNILAAHLAKGVRVPIRYWGPAQLTMVFKGQFRRVALKSMGCFLPPTGLSCAFEKRRTLLRLLQWLEQGSEFISAKAFLSDHYLIELERL